MVQRIWILFSFLLFSCAHGVRETPSYRIGPGPGLSSSRSCHPLSNAERQRVLAAANPANYPHTRYRRGASGKHATDCSHFVHEVYQKAGLPFGFRTTAELGNAREFDVLPERDARPGDLMLFRGHVGIVGEDGRIISALYRRHHRQSSIAAVDRKYFKTFHGQRYVLRYRCPPADIPARTRTIASEDQKKKKKP